MRITITSESVGHYVDIANSGGGILQDVSGNYYVFAHHHGGQFTFRGQEMSEVEFISNLDNLAGDRQIRANLVCCEPGVLSGSTIRGKNVSLSHVLTSWSNPRSVINTSIEEGPLGLYYIVVEEKIDESLLLPDNKGVLIR